MAMDRTFFLNGSVFLFICFWEHGVFITARGLCLVVMHRLLIAGTSLVAEHRL